MFYENVFTVCHGKDLETPEARSRQVEVLRGFRGLTKRTLQGPTGA